MSLMHSIVNSALRKGKRVYDAKDPPDYPAARAEEVRQNRYALSPKAVTVTESVMGLGVPQPAAAVCIAPCVQFDQTFPSYSENADRDSIVANLSEEVFDMYLRSRDPGKVRDPLFAPYYGDFAGCAPVYLWASTAEILFDDSVKMYEKLRETGHPVNLYLRDGMMHTWMIIPYFPEAKKDLKRMKIHLDDAFAGKFVREKEIVHL
jgi:acetyl esterase/lipase